MSDIIPPVEPLKRTTVTLPERLWDRLDKLEAETLAPNGKPAYTRDQLIAFLLDWAIGEHAKRQTEKKVKR